VVTAIRGKRTAAPLSATALERGALAIALDYGAAWKPEAMSTCNRFICDDRAQVVATKAGLKYLQGIPEVIDADLGEVAAGILEGRQSADQRILCLNLGMAMEDMITARLVVDRAREIGVGLQLPR
jgi:ornithine cyclodeaminase/alanine dehydrogenase